MTSKPRKVRILGMKLGGYLFTALAVSGIKGARAWLRRWCGTWEPVVPIVRSVQLDFWSPWPEEGELQAEATVRGRVPLRSTGTDRLVVAMKALYWSWSEGDGSSGFVGRSTISGWDEPVSEPKLSVKPFEISKWKLVEAFEKVKANRGTAGVDGESVTAFEAKTSKGLRG
jgi:hypothetical protein